MNVLDSRLAAILCFLGLAGVSACNRQERPEPPLIAIEQCERVALIDSLTGSEIVGAEDLDVDRAGGRLLISAYDRTAVEQAVKRRSSEIPEGGVYAVSLGDLAGRNNHLRANRVVDSKSMDAGLRPHGIAYHEDTGGLFIINRGYVKADSRWRLQAQILTYNSTGEATAARAVSCPANDLTIHDSRTLVTLDHGACGLGAGLEDVFGLRRAKLIEAGGEIVVDGLGFANGVVAVPGGPVFVAATRERALYPILVGKDGSRKQKAIPLGAAPDNLSLSDEGKIVAAVHPSLLAIGLQRRLGVGRSPSRIVEIDPATGNKTLLFDDRKASLISAATAAISTRGLLVIGSVVESGLVVCRGGA